MRTTKLCSPRALIFAVLLMSLQIISCTDTDDKVVINPPTSEFSFQPDPINTLQLKFINNSTSIKSFSWNFGDGKVNSSLRSPVYTYKDPGTYSVTLKTVGWNNVEVSTTKEVIAIKPVAINFVENNTFTDAESWTTSYVFGSDITATFNGKLSLSAGVDDQAGLLIYQAIALEAGTYKIAANINMDDTQYYNWAEFYFLPAEPAEEEEPADEFKVIGFSTFDGCYEEAFSGDLSEFGCRSGENPDTGEVVIATAGTYYFAIYTGVYDGYYGEGYSLNSVGLFKVN